MNSVTLDKGTFHERTLEVLDPIEKRREAPMHSRPYHPGVRKTIKLMIVFQEDILLKIEALAKETGVSLQEEIRFLVGEALKKR